MTMRKKFFGIQLCVLLATAASAAGDPGGTSPDGGGSSGSGGRWRWPQGQEIRIDNKVRFLEPPAAANHRATSDKSGVSAPLADAPAPFKQATAASGFYSRPGEGRFPVRAVDGYRTAFPVDAQNVYPVHDRLKPENDGSADSLVYCKCVSTPECNPKPESAEACGAGRFLCCYKRPNKKRLQNSEFFNEIDDERPMLYPGKEKVAGPFPPPPSSALHGEFGPGHGHEAMLLGAYQPTSVADELLGPGFDRGERQRPVLVGPDGPTGKIGPQQRPGLLVGPEGPTGKVGPQQRPGLLVGPEGPTGKVGPQQRPGLLVGPGGPTGIIGPARGVDPARDNGQSATAQRGVLVGPGGPTGIIGPYGRTGQRGFGYMRPQNPGVLVGPGGPTGFIGPGRRLLVGPGGPTGMIGPGGYFGK